MIKPVCCQQVVWIWFAGVGEFLLLCEPICPFPAGCARPGCASGSTLSVDMGLVDRTLSGKPTVARARLILQETLQLR
ncbi:MAG TPA: hypothetical protein DDZ90_18550 [Planctomycetaceae bacterium]|nr:hypothetical protein [Gimesia sp.]HBL45384.1 hypothetical protein [Planctomycetaceae bacterium]